MHRAAANAAVADAAAEAVAPLLKLVYAAHEAGQRGRLVREAELHARAVAAAEASLPRDSLITARLLQMSITPNVGPPLAGQAAHATPHLGAAVDTAHQNDEVRLTLSRKALMLFDARFRAGTLFTLTPEERAFFEGENGGMPLLAGAAAYIGCAEILLNKPPQRVMMTTTAEDVAILHAVHGAMQAALQLHAHGWLKRCPATGRPWEETSHALRVTAVQSLVDLLLVPALDSHTWRQLRATCHVSDAEETALRELGERNQADLQAKRSLIDRVVRDRDVERRQRAAADMARHGLRACALPECDAVEPQPKTFKICSRCRAVCYCSAAHQQADWRRHKRADGCKAPA
jgi:hypothetical protein